MRAAALAPLVLCLALAAQTPAEKRAIKKGTAIGFETLLKGDLKDGFSELELKIQAQYSEAGDAFTREKLLVAAATDMFAVLTQAKLEKAHKFPENKFFTIERFQASVIAVALKNRMTLDATNSLIALCERGVPPAAEAYNAAKQDAGNKR